MRPALLALVLAPLVAGCPGTPVENPDDDTTTGDSSSTTSDLPTDGMTGIMTTDNPTLTTAMATTDESTSTSTTTTEPDPTTETGESTGEGPAVVVEGLSHPESILYDAADGVYLISNIVGDPSAMDNDGFISRVMPDGTVASLRWIDGAAMDIELHAPKGMGIYEDVLYVADVTAIQKFDRVSGAQLSTIPVPGAMFLNDVTVNTFGRVFVSDTATNKIHLIETDDTVSDFVTASDINGTNGLLFDVDLIFAVGFNANELFQIQIEGATPTLVYTFDVGQLDGIARVEDGFLVSSWEGQAVYKVSADFTTATPVVEGVQSPADIEVDPDNDMLLIPQLELDRAVFYAL